MSYFRFPFGRSISVLVGVMACVCVLASHAWAGPSSRPAQMGINLAGPSDWNSELPFVDVFRMSRKWISQAEGQRWGAGPELELDEHGWITRLPEGEGFYASSLLLTMPVEWYPQGQYTVLYEGTGEMTFVRAKVISREHGRIVIEPVPRGQGFILEIRETDPDDYIRNIRVIMPGFENIYENNPWTPSFLGRWRGFSAVRFMDFMHTNNSEVRDWSDRPQLDDATFSKQGIPVELMVDFANRVQIDPWFCMPHQATDEYVHSFAEYVAEHLDPNQKAYIEWSNEVWNGQFAQSRYARERGVALGLADNKPWQASWRYTAQRSVEIFRIWEDAFGGTERLVRVLSSQAVNYRVSEEILGWNNAASHADALAIAPYASMVIDKTEAEKWVKLGADAVIEWMQKKVLPDTIEKEFEANVKIAREHGLKLLAYEAGQHIVGHGGAQNNKQLTEVLQAANRHPDMEKIYNRYFDAWAASGGGLIMHFNSVAKLSKWGSWGLMENIVQDPTKTPKMKGIFDAALSWGQPVDIRGGIPRFKTGSTGR